MAQYRVMRQSYIRGRVYEAGAVVEYDGYPSDNLMSMDEEGEQLTQAAAEHFAAMRAAAQLQGNPEAAAMGAAFVNELEKRGLVAGRSGAGGSNPGIGLEGTVTPGVDTSDETSARGRRSKS